MIINSFGKVSCILFDRLRAIGGIIRVAADIVVEIVVPASGVRLGDNVAVGIPCHLVLICVPHLMDHGRHDGFKISPIGIDIDRAICITIVTVRDHPILGCLIEKPNISDIRALDLIDAGNHISYHRLTFGLRCPVPSRSGRDHRENIANGRLHSLIPLELRFLSRINVIAAIGIDPQRVKDVVQVFAPALVPLVDLLLRALCIFCRNAF